MAQTPPSAEASPEARDRRPAPRLWAVVLAACAGQFLVVLDVSVVNVALPSMRSDLGLSGPGLQWVLNAYTLTFAGFMLLGGRAGDLFGRKRMFLVGLGLFVVASLAGGLAQEGWQLVTARAAQGVGAAVLSPATLTILTTTFPTGAARTRAIGTWTAVGAGGGAAGGFVGGVLTDALSWRWVLLINVPVGAVVLFAAWLWLAESRAGERRRLDVPGALLVTAGLGSLAYGIVETESKGWTGAGALLPLFGGILLLAAFVAVEARTRAPLMPLKLFRMRSVSAANVAMFVNGAAMFCMWYFMSLYMQNVLDYTPIQAGLGFVPQSLAIVLGSKLAPPLMQRVGARNLAIAGTLTASAGYFWQSGMQADGGYLDSVLGPGLLMALGAGLSATPLASIATSGAAPGDAGLVSGLINTSRTMGGALGLAALSTVAASRIGDRTGPVAEASGHALAFRTGGWILIGSALLMMLTLPGGRERDQDPPAEEDPQAGEDRHTGADPHAENFERSGNRAVKERGAHGE
ncbi:MFS transporter [Streptomyces sp. N2-109]|uniref:MFS transporter n=2 Tax=Streptomyces gossypii TaxID=2883101 RepID=A0ABT2JQL1_9ACTN|nr:MFS transporter [Streptomyces gossypii]MCT2590174.1 MFS transporter [Streptomyces gossypii]